PLSLRLLPSVVESPTPAAVLAFGSTHRRFQERKGAMAKARGLSGLKPPWALSPPVARRRRAARNRGQDRPQTEAQEQETGENGVQEQSVPGDRDQLGRVGVRHVGKQPDGHRCRDRSRQACRRRAPQTLESESAESESERP